MNQSDNTKRFVRWKDWIRGKKDFFRLKKERRQRGTKSIKSIMVFFVERKEFKFWCHPEWLLGLMWSRIIILICCLWSSITSVKIFCLEEFAPFQLVFFFSWCSATPPPFQFWIHSTKGGFSLEDFTSGSDDGDFERSKSFVGKEKGGKRQKISYPDVMWREEEIKRREEDNRMWSRNEWIMNGFLVLTTIGSQHMERLTKIMSRREISMNEWRWFQIQNPQESSFSCHKQRWDTIRINMIHIN